ncbi:DNA polymerase III subunit beta [Cytobacillus oceanisediminis]|uniref:DNA polymerase III subunit beta n=1 Tax=Cytobacillus oceanisediminis TaxID=665099 RepID=UPI003734E566
MEFKIKHEFFNNAISNVSKAVSSKTPFPILTGIKVAAEEDCLTLTGSNSDIFIEKIIPAVIDGVKVLEVFESGNAVITAKFLSEIVKKLPSDIHIKVDEEQHMTITSDDILTNLNGFPSEEYPKLPQMEHAEHIKIPAIKLMEIIKQTAFAASKNESRPVLTGVHMSFKENRFSCAATNSHRLALRETEIDCNITGSFIVPGSSLNQLAKLMNHEAGVIHIFLTDSYIVFKAETILLYSRLIEGRYPDVSGLIPQEATTVITLNTNQLLNGIDRATLFAGEWKNNNVHLEVKEDSKLRISSNSSAIGYIEETQKINDISGEKELSISLDGTFLMEALKTIQEDEVRLSFGSSMRPVLIKPVGNDFYLHLISPVRTN